MDGVFPIRLARRYDSQSQFDSPLGFGWGWVFDRRLYEYADGSVVIRHGCGNRNRFVQSGGAYVTPPAGMPGTLSELPDGTFEFLHVDGRKDFYDLEGRLTATEDVRGNRHEYTYDPAGKLPISGVRPLNRRSGNATSAARTGSATQSYRLTRIDERAPNGVLTGHYVTFAYGSEGRLASVTTNDGRVVTYGHEISSTMCRRRRRAPQPCRLPHEWQSKPGQRIRMVAVLDYEYGFRRCINGGPPGPLIRAQIDHLLRPFAKLGNVFCPPLVANAITIRMER